MASVSRPVVDLDVGTGGPLVSGRTSQGIKLVASIMARTVWETPFVANPAVIWGAPLEEAAAGVWVVAVVVDAVPVVVVTIGKFTRRLNRLVGLGPVTPLSGEVIQGSAEIGAAAKSVSGLGGGATLAFAFPEFAESCDCFHLLSFPGGVMLGRVLHCAKGS